MFTGEMIEELLRYGERITLECKKAENGLPHAIWETYSSFANTSGGVILLGVEENMKETDIQKRFSFCGVNKPEKIVKEFWDTINSKKVSSNILIDHNVGICQIEEKNIIWIEVPQGDYRNKPIYLNENPIKGSYKRNHEGDYHCTEEEVKAMLRDATDTGQDGRLLDGYTMDDIDEKTLKAYRLEYELHNPEHVWNSLDDKEFLRNLGGYTVDRVTRKEGITAAGLLMFGKGLSVCERFDNIRMDYLDQTDLKEESRWSDRLTYDGSWENNLYNFVKRVMPRLVNGLKRPFYLEGKVSNSRLQSVLPLHATDIGKCLYQLVEKNMLIQEKRGRWTTYYINENYQIEAEQLEFQDVCFPKVPLKETDQLIYDFVKANGMITSQQVVDITNITTLQGASVALNRLISKGILRKERKGRHIYYKE